LKLVSHVKGQKKPGSYIMRLKADASRSSLLAELGHWQGFRRDGRRRYHDNIATFSDFGSVVDIFAPGVNVFSSTNDG